MKQKILNALKTKYKNLGLGEKAFDGVALFLETTITDEKEIESAIAADNIAALLKAIQGETDTIRTAKSELEKSFNAYKEQHPEEKKKEESQKPEKEQEEDSELMKMLKQMQADNAALKARLDKQDTESKRTSIISSVKESLKADGKKYNESVIDLLLNKATINENDTAETLLASTKVDLEKLGSAALAQGAVPSYGGYAPQGGYQKNMNSNIVKALREKHPDSFSNNTK